MIKVVGGSFGTDCSLGLTKDMTALKIIGKSSVSYPASDVLDLESTTSTEPFFSVKTFLISWVIWGALLGLGSSWLLGKESGVIGVVLALVISVVWGRTKRIIYLSTFHFADGKTLKVQYHMGALRPYQRFLERGTLERKALAEEANGGEGGI